ncbi:MAG: geranylgeranyl reductase family protein [Bacteroidetes bacterium]|nr:geranylgeranyl reductase family protein [Bacteroidota bacterium]
MPVDYDVIISGAGPAGSFAAYSLAKQNRKVLLIDKEKFPRYKVCGGGLTHKVAQFLPFDISEVIERQIYNVVFSHQLDYQFKKRSKEPFIFCVSRDKFDAFLVRKAREAGAEFLEEQAVEGVEEKEHEVIVKTAAKAFTSHYMIGADGAMGITASSVGLMKNVLNCVAIESEMEVDPSFLEESGRTIYLDWGTMPVGYAWMFPKGDHISIGVGTSYRLSRHLRKYYRRFIIYLPVKEVRTISYKAYSIPIRQRGSKIVTKRVALAGDAAGLSDPLTGEGIYYALASGSMAAEAIDKLLKGEIQSLEYYEKRVNLEIFQDLLAVYPLMHFFNAMPGYFHNLMDTNERYFRAFIRILRGEKKYDSFRKRFGPFQFLWKAAWKFARYKENIKIQNFRFERKIGNSASNEQ